MAGAGETTVTLRPARSSDAARTCPLLYISGPELWDFVFGRADPPAAIVRLFTDGKGPYGWRTCTVAEVDGAIVGAVMWYAEADQQRLNRQSVLQAFRVHGLSHRASILRRAMTMPSVMPPVEQGEGYLYCLAVEVSQRGVGIATALVGEVGLLAIARGCRTMVLDVSSENHRARRLYEHLGFQVTAEHAFKGPRDAGVPTHLRMKRDLVV